jgi:Protein of unknown function (DUF1580)
MISLERETLIPLSHCPRLGVLPVRRAGRPIHAATWHRWAIKGLRGVRLETIRVGGTRCTSLAAIERFFQALTAATPRACLSISKNATTNQPAAATARDLKAMEEELVAHGL